MYWCTCAVPIKKNCCHFIKQFRNLKYVTLAKGLYNQFFSDIKLYINFILGIDLAWVIELRDTGDLGFLLPPSEIIPTAEELINSFMALGDELRNPTGP